MEKKLTSKVQRLSKALAESAKSFSSTITIDAEDEETLEKRGSLYAVFTLSSKQSFDPLLITKVITDVLHDSYYRSESTSPVQALEKAVVEVRDRVTKISREAASELSAEFNILAAVLWGNVLYLVQYGKGGSFLVREGEVKPVNSATEGSFSVASGAVKDKDVIILATQKFIETCSPADLIGASKPISASSLPDEASAMLIKFDVVVEFGEEDKVEFAGVEDVSGGGLFGHRKAKEEMVELVEKRKPKIKLRKPKAAQGLRSSKTLHFLLFGLVGALLIGSVLYTFVKNRKEGQMSLVSSAINKARKALTQISTTKESSEETRVALEEAKEVLEEAGESEETKKLKKEVLEKLDIANKVVRVDGEVFYDIALVDSDASPSEVTVLDGLVVVGDLQSGKVYVSDLATPKFEAEKTVFPGINSLTYYESDLAFVDDKGFKVYDISSSQLSEEYSLEKAQGETSTYLDFIYSLSGDTLTKYEKEDNTLSGSVWAKNSEFEGTVSITIDGSIYFLKSDGSLLSFTGGEKDVFAVTGLDVGFSSPVDVVTGYDMENIYVADAGNNRVVVLDKEGNLIKQFLTKEEGMWSGIKDIGVSQDEAKLFVLAGTKVFEVDLSLNP